MQKITIGKRKEGKKGKPRLSAKNGQPGRFIYFMLRIGIGVFYYLSTTA